MDYGMKQKGSCHVPKPKVYFKKITKTYVKKIYYVPKVKKSTKTSIRCGVLPCAPKRHKKPCRCSY